MLCITVPGVVVVLWKYTSWHQVILGGANSCVALFLQLGQMQTIADPRGGNVRGLHCVFSNVLSEVFAPHTVFSNVLSEVNATSGQSGVRRARKLSLRHNLFP